jgi:adenylate kinase family enzyme
MTASHQMMRRIMIIGSGGAGKSTLARQLSERLSLPLVGLDACYWSAGWVPTPPAEWSARVDELSSTDAWVMDGNYGGTLDLRLERCDTVIFLDLPRVVCLWSAIARWIRHRGKSRPDMAEGCPEKIDWEFARWIWNYPSSRREGILAKLAALPPSKQAIVLRSRRAVAEFVESLTQSNILGQPGRSAL